MASPDQRSALADAVANAARQTVLMHLRDAPTGVEVAIISRDGALLGRAGNLSLSIAGKT